MLYKCKTNSKQTFLEKQKTKSNLLPPKIFYFCWTKIGEKIRNTEKTFQDFLTSHNEKVLFEELNFDDFQEEFKSLKRNKAAGFDDLSSNIIIDGYDSLKNILFHFFKVSIQRGLFPDSLKIAKVTPIFKSRNKHKD